MLSPIQVGVVTASPQSPQQCAFLSAWFRTYGCFVAYDTLGILFKDSHPIIWVLRDVLTIP